MANMPHTIDAAAVPRLLRLVQNTTTPGSVSVQHLRSHGFDAAEAPHHLALLRGLGFIDRQGRPTTRWTIYRDPAAATAELVVAIRDSYAAVFDAFEDVARHSDEAIAKVVSNSTAYGRHQVQQTVKTFRALVAATQPARRAEPGGYSGIELERDRRDVVRERAALAAIGNSEFESAQRCIDAALPRPAHVAAWSGFMAFALMRLSIDDFAGVRRVRPDWGGVSVDELASHMSGREIVDLLIGLDLIAPLEEFELAVLLQRRNRSANPITFDPSRSDAAFFLDQMLTRSERLMRSTAVSVP